MVIYVDKSGFLVFFPFPPIENDRKWLYQLLPIKYVWTKITIRSYVWSFGHSDPDPSNVGCLNIFFPCSALPLIINLTKKWILYLPKFIIWYVQYFREQVTFSTFKKLSPQTLFTEIWYLWKKQNLATSIWYVFFLLLLSNPPDNRNITSVCWIS